MLFYLKTCAFSSWDMELNPIPEYHYLPLFDSFLLLKTANAATATLKTISTISIGTIPPVI